MAQNTVLMIIELKLFEQLATECLLLCTFKYSSVQFNTVYPTVGTGNISHYRMRCKPFIMAFSV